MTCQDLSVAGKRAGLDASRSGLFFEFVRLINEMREATDGEYPKYVLIENVPGLLSSKGGRDFAVLLNTLAECGAVDIAYRIIDSQHWVPQRRRRVFILASFTPETDDGSGIGRASKILSLTESVQRDNPPSREKGQDITQTLTGGSGERGWGDPVNSPMVADPLRSRIPATGGNRGIEAGQRVVQPFVDPAYSLSAGLKGLGDKTSENYNLVAGALTARDAKGADNIYAEEGKLVSLPVMAIRTSHTKANGPNYKQDGSSFTIEATTSPDSVLAPTLNASGTGTERPGRQGAEPEFYVPTMVRMREGKEGGGKGALVSEDKSLTLASGNDQTLFHYGVRRLTAVECEFLQGFPMNWTCLCDPPCSSTSEKHCSDGNRYKALGNAVTVPTVRWIMARIKNADLTANNL